MAQSALTVTPPSPSPPTNMSSTGASPPNPPNYTKVSYAEPFGARNADGSFVDEAPPGVRVNVNPPPYFDDGTAGALHLFASNTSALASGTGVTSGGTEGSYPGAAAGAVPASTSVAHEGAGTETRVLAPGNISHTYVVGTLDMSQSVSAGPVATVATREAGPNATHASTASPITNPALASITPTTAVSATSGTQLITCTGTNFNNQCKIWVDNVERTTTYVSATSLTTTVNKKREAGPWLVDVKLGGVAVPSTRTFTWT